jgi:hypothetical protein
MNSRPGRYISIRNLLSMYGVKLLVKFETSIKFGDLGGRASSPKRLKFRERLAVNGK